MSLSRALRRDRAALEEVAALAALAAETGLSRAAELLDAAVGEATRSDDRKAACAEALADVLRTGWPPETSKRARARRLSDDLKQARRRSPRRNMTVYEAKLAEINSLFAEKAPSPETILRLASRASD